MWHLAFTLFPWKASSALKRSMYEGCPLLYYLMSKTKLWEPNRYCLHKRRQLSVVTVGPWDHPEHIHPRSQQKNVMAVDSWWWTSTGCSRRDRAAPGGTYAGTSHGPGSVALCCGATSWFGLSPQQWRGEACPWVWASDPSDTALSLQHAADRAAYWKLNRKPTQATGLTWAMRKKFTNCISLWLISGEMWSFSLLLSCQKKVIAQYFAQISQGLNGSKVTVVSIKDGDYQNSGQNVPSSKKVQPQRIQTVCIKKRGKKPNKKTPQ